ncbi:putative importin-beta domain, armadillo-like helical [Helianthus annuus]|nr:putative importin-beta domain, armadillo-like helical [Helianthus annuus]
MMHYTLILLLGHVGLFMFFLVCFNAYMLIIQRTAADHILWELQNNPDMWLQVVHILSNTQSLNTKFFALQVLEGVIKYRWNVLPVEQRDGMKNYISDVIVKLSSNEVSFRQERLYVNKLNIILVQVSYFTCFPCCCQFSFDLDIIMK